MDKDHLLRSAVCEGSLQKVKELISSFGISYKNEGSEGFHLLLVALRKNHVDVAKLLLLNGSKVNSDKVSVTTPLHCVVAIGNVEIVKMLLDRNAKIDAKDKYGRTSLHYAVEKNQIKIVRLLLNRRARVDTRDNDGITPLHIASMECCSDLVKMLLTYGAFVNSTSYLTSMQKIREGYTPLHYAVEKGSEEITKLLLKNNSDVNIKALRGTPLHIAVEEGYLEIVDDLLNHGAYVNSACTSTGCTPLHLAAAGGNIEATALLLVNGAYVNAVSKNNQMALYLATENGHATIVKLLLEHGADINGQDNHVGFKKLHGSLLHIAAERGYQQVVEYLLDHGASLSSVCPSTGYTPLHVAVDNGGLGAIESMLSKGAHVNAIANDNVMPLHIATRRQLRSVVKLLLEHGADVDAEDVDGKTILYHAVENALSYMVKDILMFCPDLHNKSNKNSLDVAIIYSGLNACKKIVESLLEYGFTVNAKDINNRELLHAAVSAGYLEIVGQFLQNGADVNITSNKEGYTLLHEAIIYQHEEMVKLLINCGADVNAKDKMKNAPICYAVDNVDITVIKLLLTNGANLKDYPDLLKVCIKEGYNEIVKVFLQRNFDIDFNWHTARQLQRRRTRSNSHLRNRNKRITQVYLDNQSIVNAKNRDGTTALHIAAYRGNEEIVDILLKCGAEVNVKAKGYMMPLHVAAQSGHSKIIESLLKFGADINSTDQYGRTALHIACLGRHRDVIIVLLQNGIDINITSQHHCTALDFALPNLPVWQLQARYHDFDSNIDEELHEEVGRVGTLSTEKITEELLRYLVVIRAEKFFVNKHYLLRVNGNADLKRLYNCLKVDLKQMKKKKIRDTNISFYDVLTKVPHQLAIYSRNRSIAKVFESHEYKKMFPRYADALEIQFEKGRVRAGLLSSSIKSINFLFGYELPHLLLNEVISYLSNWDLKNLIDACPHDAIGNC